MTSRVPSRKCSTSPDTHRSCLAAAQLCVFGGEGTIDWIVRWEVQDRWGSHARWPSRRPTTPSPPPHTHTHIDILPGMMFLLKTELQPTPGPVLSNLSIVAQAQVSCCAGCEALASPRQQGRAIEHVE